MFYRICRVINIVLGCLFIIIDALSLFGAREYPSSMVVVMVIFFITGIFFVVFSLICGRLYKYNNEQITITKQFKTTAKTIFVFNLLSSLVVLLLITAGIFSFLDDTPGTMQQEWPLYFTMFFVFLLAGGSGIVNLFFYRHLLKENSVVATDLIDDIGKYS